MTIFNVEWTHDVLLYVVNPAVRAVALAGCAALILAVFRVKAISSRLFTWKTVLCASLAMPVLGVLLPPLRIPTPQLVRSQAVFVTAQIESPRGKTPVPAVSNPSLEVEMTQSSAPSAVQGSIANTSTRSPSFLPTNLWESVAAAIYLAVALILLVRLAIGIMLSHRLCRLSQDIHQPGVTEQCRSQSRAYELSFLPRMAESDLISVPVTMGVIQPTILLPTCWREWDAEKLKVVLAHEISHVTRRDALTQMLSQLHRAIFWFSPFAWWLDRHLSNLAEQASDEAALALGTDRNEYARTLLGFFEALHAVPGRVWWQGVAMAKVGQAERRLERILAWKGTVAMSLKKSIAIAITVFALPVVYLVASAQPLQENNQAAPAPAPAASPKPSAASPAVPAALPAPAAPAYGISTPGPDAVPPMAPPDPAEAPGDDGYSYSYGYDDHDRFVIVSGKTDALTMSGSIDDAHHVEKLRKRIPGDFIWFERDGKSYIIQDQTTIDRARQFWRGQDELGRKQAELGKQQEALGKQQEELSQRMEKVRVDVPNLTAQMDKLRAELDALGSSATVEQLSKLQSEMGELQARLGESQSRAGVTQSKLGGEMGELGERQGELGQRQGDLGRQQAELARQANRQMKGLLDDAIKRGTAKPEPDSDGHSMF